MSEEESKGISENKEDIIPKKKRKWPKILLILFGLFCCLLVGIYFYISSAAFVRGQVFTRVQAQLNQPITAEGINFSPLSTLEMNDFTLGDDPFLKAEKVKISYDLMSIVNGDIKVDEVTVENAEMNVIINRDGKLNILSKVIEKIEDEPEPKPEKKKTQPKKKDPNAVAEKKPKPKPKPKKKIAEKTEGSAGPPPNLNINNINLKNLKLNVFLDHSKEEKRFEMSIDNFNFSVPSIKNGEELKYELEAAITCKAGEKFNLNNGKVKISGKSRLSQALKPELLGVEISVSDLDAVNDTTSLPLKALTVLADIGMDNGKVNLKSFKVENPEKQSGLSVSGVVEDGNVDLSLAVQNVDSSILDLALIPLSGSKPFMRWQQALKEASEGKIAGFGNTLVNYKGTVKGDPQRNLDLSGEIEIASLPMISITRKSDLVPITTKIKYELNSNKDEFLLELKKLNLDVSDNKNQLASINIDSPIIYDSWYGTLQSEKDDKISLKLNNFDLNLVKAFMKKEKHGTFERGFISADCQLISKNSGKELSLELKDLSLIELAVKKDEQIISNVNIQTSSRLSLSDLTKVELEDLVFSVKQGNNQLAEISAGGLINLDNIEANINLSSLKVHPHIQKFVPQQTIDDLGLRNINLSSDSLKVHYSKGGVNAEGKLTVQNLGLGGTKLPAPTTLSKSTEFKVSYDETETLTVESLDLNLITDGQRALSTKLSAKQNTKLKLVSVQFSDLRAQAGLTKFIPKDLQKKFGLANINLNSKDLKIDMLDKKIAVKGSISSNGLILGGEQFGDSFKLSHSTSLDVEMVQDHLIDIRDLNLNLLTDNNQALSLAAKGIYQPGDKAVNLKVAQLEVSPGLRHLLPPALVEQYGIENLNAKSSGIEVNYNNGQAGYVKAKLGIKNLGIGGKAYKPFALSQDLDVDVAIDKNGLLKIGKLISKTNPSFAEAIEVQAKGQVDLNFNRDDSEIVIDVPSVVDIDALLKLAKKQEKKEVAKVELEPETAEPKAEVVKFNEEQVKDKTVPSNAVKAPAPPKKNPIKLTVKTSVNEIIFDKQSVKNIRSTAFINDQTYTLKQAVMQIGEGIFKASGKVHNGPMKSMSVNVSSSGPINLSPINDILNKGSNKEIAGNVTIQKFSAATSGKDNEELTKNLNAIGKLIVQDLKVENYANVPGFSVVLDNIMGVDPGNLEFDQGLMDIKINDGILTINQMSFEGPSMAFNPRGTVNLNNNTYDIQMKTGAGFGGGKLLQMITNNPGLVNLINSKTKELREFQEIFPYDATKKKFVMKDDFLFNKIINLSNEGKEATMLENVSGLNSLASDFLIEMFIAIGETANMKETTAIANTLSGKGNLKDNLLNIGKGLLDRELNKEGSEGEDDPVGGLLDGLFGGDKKKESEKKQPPKEEEKKEEEPINKKDDLIKKIDSLFR